LTERELQLHAIGPTACTAHPKVLKNIAKQLEEHSMVSTQELQIARRMGIAATTPVARPGFNDGIFFPYDRSNGGLAFEPANPEAPFAPVDPKKPKKRKIHAIALLVDFSDNKGAWSAKDFDKLLFDKANQNSMANFYRQLSYGALDVTGEVIGYVRAPQPYNYYTATESGTITESNGISSNGIHQLNFNGQFFPHGPLSVTNATGDFIPIVGSQANFNLPIRWTGSDSSVNLLDVLPGVGGPAWSILIAGATDGFATGTFFSLKSVTFDEDSLTLIGFGTTQLISGDPLVQKDSAARIVIQGTGQDFTYNLTVVTTAVTPEGGSGLCLLAIGLVGLVAVEGLRRKIATRQNRYA
jgi:hypothetical protein